MRNLRIAIVHENWAAGAGKCARDLERELSRLHQTRFYPRSPFENKLTLFQDLAKFHPDVVHLHSFYAWLDYRALADISRSYPTVYTVHDTRPIGAFDRKCYSCNLNSYCLRCPLVPGRLRKLFANQFFRSRLKKRLTHLRCPRKLTVVSPSHWMSQRLKRHELQRFRHEVIPNGVDLSRFREIADAKSRFGFTDKDLVILHLAYYTRQFALNDFKGLPLLFQAFVDSVLPKVPHALLAVAGEHVIPNHPRVRPLGIAAQADLPALISACDVYASAAIADNFPYTVIESMACGRPVIATRVGGIPEQILHGETGYLIDPGDSATLGKTLIEILQNRHLRRQMGIAARQRAQQCFGLQTFVDSYEHLFGDVSMAAHPVLSI